MSIFQKVSKSTYHVLIGFLSFLFLLLGRRSLGGISRSSSISRSRSRNKGLRVFQIFLDLCILLVFEFKYQKKRYITFSEPSKVYSVPKEIARTFL